MDVLDSAPNDHGTVPMWCTWMFEWMTSHPEQTMGVFRLDDLVQQFGSSFEKLQTDQGRVQYALPKIKEALDLWMAGEPLTDIQPALGGRRADVAKSISARKFVVRLLPALAHIFDAPSRIIRQDRDEDDLDDRAPTVFRLGRCVRHGFSSVEMYALHEHVQSLPLPPPSRREIHRHFAALGEHLLPASDVETWSELRERVADAWASRNAAGSDHAQR